MLTEILKKISTEYVIFMVLLSSVTLIFIDRVYMKSKELKSEASFSMIMGIIYAVIGIVLFIFHSMTIL